MTSLSKLPFLAGALAACAALAASAPAAAATVDWAASVLGPDGRPRPEVVGAPDARYDGNPWTASKFTLRADYAALAATLGLAEAELARYQVIAWEGNAGSPAASGGWESADWVFADALGSVGTRFDETTGTGSSPEVVFRTGSITGADYARLFGVEGQPVMSWLLAQLPARIDAASASFSVRFSPVGGGLGVGEGTPDPDAIGVLRSVPEPGSLLLVAAGAAGLLAGRRRLRLR